MDYTKAKATNIVLGFVSLGLDSYNIANASIYHQMDEIFVGVVSICILEAIISLLLAYYCKNRVYARLDHLVRGIIFLALIAVGAGLIYSAVDIHENYNSNYCYSNNSFSECQFYEVKIAAGVIAIINAIIYACTKRRIQLHEGIVHSPGMVAVPVTPYMVQQGGHEMTQMHQQQQAYQIPSFQTYSYNPNYTGPQPVQNPNYPLQQNPPPYQYQYSPNPNQQQVFNPPQQQVFNPPQQQVFNPPQQQYS